MYNESHKRIPTLAIKQAMHSLLDYHNAPDGDVSVAIVGNEKIRELNRTYRELDEPTDVLTFTEKREFLHEPLGEIVISYDMARQQAAARGAATDHELICLTIHGGLHLLGFDDSTDNERDEMIRSMNDHLRRLEMETDENWSSLPHGGCA
ncbi:MAG: Endoribonuclease YbeY [Fimbriimonadaceae bacterium]|nr:Endoribonuclease YbeY [Fimbriimonadaceae bacterium]